MTRVLATVSAPTWATSDGFGRRVRAADPEFGDEVELLELEASLVEHDGFVAALGDRVARVSSVRHASYVHLRRLDRPEADRLTLVSDYTPGWRLSDLLRMGVETATALETTVVIGLLRQLLPAVSLFSRHNRDSAIGALAPERLIVTPQARLVIPEHAFGPALEKLNLGRDRFWREFRIAMPASAGLPRANARADTNAVGVIALSLVLGRGLEESEYPSGLEELVESATERRKGETMPLSAPFAQWISRALQFEVRNAFQTPHEAQVAFEAVLASNRGYVTTPAPLEQWVADLGAAIDIATAPPPAPLPEPPPEEPPLPAFVTEMPAMVLEAAVPTPEAVTPELEPEPEPELESATEAEPEAVPEAEAVAEAAPEPEASADDSWIPEPMAHWTAEPIVSPVVSETETPEPVEVVAAPEVIEEAEELTAPAAEESTTAEALQALDSPAPFAPPAPPASPDAPASLDAPSIFAESAPPAPPAPPAEPALFDTPVAHETPSPFRLPMVQGLVAAVLLMAAGLGWLLTRPSAGLITGDGELIVQSRPTAKVSVDGKARGETPQKLSLSPGAHVLEVQVGNSEPRVIPIAIRPGVQTSQYIELQNVPLTGSLDIKTEPVGARVLVDGQPRGTAPALLKDLTPGDHEVVVELGGRKARQTVRIEAGITAQVVVPIPKK